MLPFLISNSLNEKIIYSTYSKKSGDIFVIQTTYGLELRIGDTTQSIRIEKPRNNYWEDIATLSRIKDKSTVLILGLGGGEIIKKLDENYKDLVIDVIEFDEKIIEVYKKYFKRYVKGNSNINIVLGDAYSYVLNNTKKYNNIICDVYFSGEYPQEYFEDNFLTKVKQSLKKNGQFVSNRIFTFRPKKNCEEYCNLLKYYFNEVSCKYVGGTTLNYVFFAAIK